MFGDPASSDIILTTGDTRIYAHKAVLVAQSALFRVMFQVSWSLVQICEILFHHCKASSSIIVTRQLM